MPPNPSGAEKALAADLNRLHLKTQAIRALRLFALYLAPQLVLALTNAWTGWRALAIVASTAAEAAIHQVWPALPLDPLLAILDRHRTPTVTATTTGGGPVTVSRFDIPAPRSPEPPAAAPVDNTPTEGPPAP